MMLFSIPIAYMAQAADAFAPPAESRQTPTVCAGAGQSEGSTFAKPTAGLTPAAYELPLRLVAAELRSDPYFLCDLGMFRGVRVLFGLASPRRGGDR